MGIPASEECRFRAGGSRVLGRGGFTAFAVLHSKQIGGGGTV